MTYSTCRKAIFRWLLCLVCGAMLLTAAACTPAGEASETQTEPESAPAETPTETEAPADTALPTESPTETPAEAETEDPAVAAAKKEEAMKTLYESYTARQLPIGGFSTPSAELRDHNTGVEGSYQAAWNLLADAGINYMITLEEWSSQYWIVEAAEAASKAGIKLYYQGLGDADRSVEFMNLILESAGADAFAGVYLKDEPTIDDNEWLSAGTQQVRDAMGDKKYPVVSNLLPTYAPASVIGKRYRDYVRNYIEACKPEFLMFDYYPFTGSDSIPALIANNAACLLEANDAGIPLYTFVQSGAWGGASEPNQYQIRLNANINLAMGSKSICYFVACEHYPNWNYSAMINADGKTTKLYDKVKTVNDEINAMKGVYLDYDCVGFMVVGFAAVERNVQKIEADSLLLSAHGVVAAAEAEGSGKFLVGCFENKDGGMGYYVTNLDYKKSVTVKLTFASDAAGSFSLWMSAGVTDIGDITPNGTLTFTLDKGAGAFVRVTR